MYRGDLDEELEGSEEKRGKAYSSIQGKRGEKKWGGGGGGGGESVSAERKSI